MRVLRLFVLTAAAVATLAALPSLASGQVEVLSEEAGGNTHCDVIAHCVVEIDGEATTIMTAHLITGAEVTALVCENVFDMELDETGEGYIYNQRLNGGSCVRKPCGATTPRSGDGDPWPIHLRENAGELSLHLTLCLENADGSGSASSCEISLHIDDLGDHFYEFTADDERCAGSTLPPGVTSSEVDGHWITESDAIEVVH